MQYDLADDALAALHDAAAEEAHRHGWEPQNEPVWVEPWEGEGEV